MNPAPNLEMTVTSSMNVWMRVIYYFGYPAAMTIALAMVLWMLVDGIDRNLTAIRVTLDARNAMFAEIIANQKVIIQDATDAKILLAEHTTQEGKMTDALSAADMAMLRRLDDIYSTMKGNDNGRPR